VAARAKAGRADLKAVLPELLASARGKGGGAPDFLQIACADPAAAEAAYRVAAAAVASAVGGD
jgi:hypothetical protein